MLCSTCGRQSEKEDANFCYYCGQSFREFHHEEIKAVLPKNETIATTAEDKPISIWNWLGSYGIMLIPVVGFVMLFLWAFGKNTKKSKKTWARATLIVSLFAILYFTAAINMYSTTPIFQDYLNGQIDINQLMNQVLQGNLGK